MISRYFNFKEDLLLESVLNESIVYYSLDLKNILKSLDNDISNDLLGIEGTDVKPDITFINLDKEGYLSFTTMRNAKKLLDKKFPDYNFKEDIPNIKLADEIWKYVNTTSDTHIYDTSRNSVKIGKIVNKFLPGKYNDKKIEDFVNKFKGNISINSEHFELVEGNDIEFWYNNKNYLNNKGTLGNSCMAAKSGIFDIYTKNPEICKLLILKKGDKISGRSLIWKLNSIEPKNDDVEYFMDRQYTSKDSDVEKFRIYAREQNWSYKEINNHYSTQPVTFPGGETLHCHMTISVKKADLIEDKPYDYKKYPYLDTFKRIDVKSGILHNDNMSGEEYSGDYLLEDTAGGYEEILSGEWSEYLDRMIPEEYAVYSDNYEDWLDNRYVIFIDYGSRRYRGYYADDDDDVVYDEWNEEYIHVNEAVYSDNYGYWLYDDDAVSAITDIDNDGDIYRGNIDYYHKDDDDIIEIDEDMIWYEVLSSRYTNWGRYFYILKSLMVENDKGYAPKIFTIKIYEVESEINIKYLSLIDAKILGYEINKDKFIKSDEFQYNKDIEEILPTLYKKCKLELKNIDKKFDQTRIKFKEFNDDEYFKSLTEMRKEIEERIEEIKNDKFNLI